MVEAGGEPDRINGEAAPDGDLGKEPFGDGR